MSQFESRALGICGHTSPRRKTKLRDAHVAAPSDRENDGALCGRSQLRALYGAADHFLSKTYRVIASRETGLNPSRIGTRQAVR